MSRFGTFATCELEFHAKTVYFCGQIIDINTGVVQIRTQSLSDSLKRESHFVFTMLTIATVFGILGVVLSGQPEVTCPAPRSPDHGQAFLYQEGRVVKYVCEPGYTLQGKELVRCIDGEWEDPNPACLEIGAEVTQNEPEDADSVPVPPARPLFSWGSEEDASDAEQQQVNDTTDGDLPLSDEARVRLLMYPRRKARIVTSTIRTGRLQSAKELEEEEKKRSQEEKTTTIHLESPPSVMYVRRTITPGKSEAAKKALDEQYQTASVHMTVENGDDVQLIKLPRAAVSLDDQADQHWRHLYWYALHNYPRSASLVDYRSGKPVVMTLTDSQLAWINSLHPDLRDQYLKDLYVMRAEETVEGERAQAFLRRYEDTYNYLYHVPYLRRPVSLIVDNVASTYDYTCNQAGYPVISAPDLPNMHVARYDSRKNTREPYNYYLAAVYQCDPGYYMLDSRFSEVYCSKGQWVVVMEDPISSYDYSCHESGYPFIKAPRFHNMHIARYDRRQNPNNPHNHYLSAVYRCNPGYVMLDTRYTELYCSQKNWIGTRPVCVRRA